METGMAGEKFERDPALVKCCVGISFKIAYVMESTEAETEAALKDFDHGFEGAKMDRL
jgi:hypothetical protein